jgi:predicted DNA-binding transcriptional regulator AlpA
MLNFVEAGQPGPATTSGLPPGAPRRLLSINEVSALLSISVHRIRQLVRADLFPVPLRIGLRNLAWTSADIEEFVQARRALAQAEHRQRIDQLTD